MVARRVFPALFALTMTAFAQQPLTISGSATYRERMALPANAIFVVTLEDEDRTDAKAAIINQFQKESPGSPPLEFTITYDPEKIIESHTYVVRAKVTVEDRLLFTSTEREQVLTKGHGSEISTPMMMRRVSSPKNAGAAKPAAAQETAPDVPLRETYWKLVELNGKPVTGTEHQREANLIFHTKDSRVSGSGGCNQLMGGYMVDGSAIHFKGVASTMMACLNGMETEQNFLTALNKVEGWRISGRSLELTGAGGDVLARFEAVALR